MFSKSKVATLVASFQNPDIPFVNAALRSDRDPKALDEAATLLYEAEIRHGIAFIDAPGIVLLREDDSEIASYDAWIENSFRPFLAETHFWLAGEDYQRLEMYDANSCDRLMSFREWGSHIADWANAHAVRPRNWRGKPIDWKYIDFYSKGYGPTELFNYEEWCDRLYAIVRRKCELYGWTFHPNLSDYTARQLRKDRQWWKHLSADREMGVERLGLERDLLKPHDGCVDIHRNYPHRCPPFPDSSGLNTGLLFGAKIREYILTHQLGRYYPGGTSFVVATNPDTVLTPSIGGFISKESGPPKSKPGWITVQPDLVIEARSEADISNRLNTKIQWWLEAGVKAVWVFEPETRRLHIHSYEGSRTYKNNEELATMDLFPGLTAL